jgi:preprotein translocase subunit SecD
MLHAMSRARIALLGLASVLVVIVVAVRGTTRVVPAIRLEYLLDAGDRDPVAARDRAVTVIRNRIQRAHDQRPFESGVTFQDMRITVAYSTPDPAHLVELTRDLGRASRLELQRIDPDAAFFETLHAEARIVAAPGVQAVSEPWPAPYDGPAIANTERFLRAAQRGQLELHVAEAKPTVPADRSIAYEHVAATDKPAYWRTHVLVREPWLTGAAIRDARATAEPTTQRAQVLIKLDDEAGRRFGELTRTHIGHKIAIVLDGVVQSAPLIQDPIPNGEIAITMGAGDQVSQLAEATRLADALSSGEIPGRLDLVSSRRFEIEEDGVRWWLLVPLGLAAVVLAMVAMLRFGKR